MQEASITNTGNDLLADLAINLEKASTGKRFLNYLVDLIICYLVLLAMYLFIPPMRSAVLENRDLVARYFIYWLLRFLLYFIQEGFMNGQTIGKMITGTRAVNEDGTPITAATAAIRSISRFVPFELFSAFGYLPWHDRWSRTIVIDERKSTLPQ